MSQNTENTTLPSALPTRRRLPDVRNAVTHRFVIGDRKGYITVGLYDDGRPGELFIRMGGMGSAERGLLNAVGILCSMCLQAGIPVEDLSRKFIGTAFEMDGWVNTDGHASFSPSVLDYIFRWLQAKFPAVPAATQEPSA